MVIKYYLFLNNDLLFSYQEIPKKREHFSQSNLTAAVEAVVCESMSKKSAAKTFSVSRSTIQHRLKNPHQKISCGTAPVLSEEEENTLEKWILESSQKGFPQRKDDLLVSVFFLSCPDGY